MNDRAIRTIQIGFYTIRYDDISTLQFLPLLRKGKNIRTQSSNIKVMNGLERAMARRIMELEDRIAEQSKKLDDAENNDQQRIEFVLRREEDSHLHTLVGDLTIKTYSLNVNGGMLCRYNVKSATDVLKMRQEIERFQIIFGASLTLENVNNIDVVNISNVSGS